MRYLYRSYCLKEGGFWLLRAPRGNHRGTESNRTEKVQSMSGESVLKSGSGDGWANMDGPIYH